MRTINKIPIIILAILALLTTTPFVYATIDSDTTHAWNFNGDWTDSKGSDDFTANGDASIDSSNKKIGSGSATFDGTGDYATETSSENYGDMLISFWLYLDSYSGTDQYIFYYQSGTERISANIRRTGDSYDNQLNVEIRGSGTLSQVVENAETPTTTWTHYVIRRQNTGDITIYRNGALSTLGYSSIGTGGTITSPDLTVGATSVPGLYFAGNIDALTLISSADTAYISTLYNSGTGAEYPFGGAPPATINSTNVTFTGTSLENATLTYNVTITDGTDTYTYTEKTGEISTPIYANSTSLWNFTLTAENHFPKTLTNRNVSTNVSMNLTQWPHINATQTPTNNKINTFNITIGGNTYYTSSGKIYLNFNSTETILAQATDHFNITKSLDLTDSQDYELIMYQSQITIYAENIINGSTITGFVASTINTTCTAVTNNCTLNLTTGTKSINITKNPYYQETISVTTNALDNITRTVYMYDHKLNISVNDLTGSGDENVFGVNIYDESGYGYYETLTTTTGTILANLTPGDYTVVINDSDWSLTNTTLTLNSSVNITNITINVYTTNSINITFLNEITEEIITENVTVDFISSVYSLNTSTTTGYLYVDLLQPVEYTCRYSSTNYSTRLAYFTIANQSTQTRTLYLMPEESSNLENVTVNIIDQSGEPVENYKVVLQKYFIDDNDYLVVDEGKTDVDGEIIVSAQLYVEFYRFIIRDSSNNIVKSTTPATIKSNTVTIQINTEGETLAVFNRYNQISYTPIVFNTATNHFRATFDDVSGLATRMCLRAYRITATGEQSVNSSCTTSSSATMLLWVANNTGYTYVAKLYATDADTGNDNLLDSLTHSFDDDFSTGITGLFWQLLITLAVFGLLVRVIEMAIISVPLTFIVGRMMSLNEFPYPVLFGLVVVALIVVWGVRKT